MNLEEAKSFIKENHIELILAQFVDIHGVAKAKAVPAKHLDMILEDGAGFAGFAVWGFGMGPHGPDLMGRGDLGSLSALKWMPGYARMACDGYVHGEPYEYDSRVVCQKAMDRLKEKTGYTLFTGLEPEFFLLRQDPVTGKLDPFSKNDNLDKPCYDYKGLSEVSDFITELVQGVSHCDLDVYQIDHEDANGQFEINFTYSDAKTTADRYILFKMAASSIAEKHGAIASFMPKPFSNKTGNGMHVHLSLGNENVGNAFEDSNDAQGLGLSPLAYQFLAGLLKHAPALTAITCPSVNSYKRLVVGGSDSGSTWAPAYSCYGDNNRTASVRVPFGHLEYRTCDSSANPYLVAAALIEAGLDGIENDLDPGPMINENVYEMKASERKDRGIVQLPQSLFEALQALEEDEVVQRSLGENLCREFIDLKKQEWTEYHRHVSDWEVQRYLRFY